MKIYQLHECGGAWEDYYNIIIGSYLKKERAEEAKAKAEAKEKELRIKDVKCNRCPFLGESFSELNALLSKHQDYCSEMKLEEGEYGLDCRNYYSKWDESDFDIVEVEVEE